MKYMQYRLAVGIMTRIHVYSKIKKILKKLSVRNTSNTRFKSKIKCCYKQISTEITETNDISQKNCKNHFVHEFTINSNEY